MPAEEGGEAPELLALPVGEGMVVALGTLDADAEEDAGGAGGQVLRLEFLGEVERQRDPAGRESAKAAKPLPSPPGAVSRSRTIWS